MDAAPTSNESTADTIASRISGSRKRPRMSAYKIHHCPHCDQTITLKTFKRHEKLYCRSDGTWMTESDCEASTDNCCAGDKGLYTLDQQTKLIINILMLGGPPSLPHFCHQDHEMEEEINTSFDSSSEHEISGNS